MTAFSPNAAQHGCNEQVSDEEKKTMKLITRAAPAACLAMLLGSSAALAQQACETYEVKRGDNLRNIARAAYGDPDLYRKIYDANVDVIGAKADLIEVGAKLNLPCADGAAVAAVAEASPAATEEAALSETAEAATETVDAVAEAVDAPAAEVTPAPEPEVVAEAAPAAPESAPAAPAPQASVRPLALVTGNDYAPFTDETLPGGGMFTQLVEMAMFRADPGRAYSLTFINDWQAHLDALLPSHAYDLTFPWSRPNCEAPETLSAGDLGRCQNFEFSQPFYEVVDGFFSRADSEIAAATTYDEYMGKRICRPEGYSTGVLDGAGLTMDVVQVVRPVKVADCFNMLMKGEVDLVALDTTVAADEIAEIGLTGQISENPQLSSVKTLHVIAHKSNPEAVAALDLLNQGILEMYESGEWYDVVSTALKNEQKLGQN
ncbi:transporter substrate-binding domain-containing protein [Frigidibacter sp. RF13]|uniref:transporter substrate-binding domain-containing protein n=1 Tax=Frigidibacter sp. RF13 TaxID=2997340 RepID=UPI00226E0812|nr:transporter substrate-binding domain-containing protein [Frigidibacter sp. RF13]MCY1128270.1 transporter substrate-binding domain-containing protein [Frigidibacter sp. RF13]